MLDEAGFPDARIVASNDLDEQTIARLKAEGARIDTWGVGTKLVTAYDQPALGGVYKLAAIESDDGTWDYKVKLSNDLIKVSNPGKLQVFRFRAQGRVSKDLLFNELDEQFLDDERGKLLLSEVMNEGQRTSKAKPIHQTREQAILQWKNRQAEKEILQLSPKLLQLKKDLIAAHQKNL